MTQKNNIEQLFKTHYAQMHRLAVMLLHDHDIARDIVHDVFDKLLQGNHSILVNGPYLMKAVRNRCLNHIRECETHQRVANAYFLDNEEYDTEEWPDEETLARIHALIYNDITPQARRVMELRFNRGMQFSNIASEMGISQTAVYRHLSHALSIIRKKLNENG
ncbi:MAG: sigma-70 family RNA polymerase sigma factor [Bacteroidales bacterium]|nr:sigma-70 family RNA polymerase sigma factor [Bacteroidales bacterium]